MVYVASIGGSATKQLIALGITPVEVKGGPDVEDLVAELYGEMSGEPGVMLKRILAQKAPKEDFSRSSSQGSDPRRRPRSQSPTTT